MSLARMKKSYANEQLQTTVKTKTNDVSVETKIMMDKCIQKQLKCPKCPMEFANILSLKLHDNFSHQAPKPKCVEMATLTPRYIRLTKFMCLFCKRECLNKSHLLRHRRTQHRINNSYKCISCEKTYPRYSDLKAHFDVVHLKIRRHSCQFCMKRFSYRSHLSRHLFTSHGYQKNPGPYECKTCSRRYRKSKQLEHHESTSHKKYYCEMCPNISYQAKNGVREHMANIHKLGHNLLVCQTCDFRTNFPSRLKLHIKNHLGVPGGATCFPCQVCHKLFKYECALEFHMSGDHGLDMNESLQMIDE